MSFLRCFFTFAKFYYVFIILANFILIDALLPFGFISNPGKIGATTEPAHLEISCPEDFGGSSEIVQQRFGRVIDTGTGAIGSGAIAPSNGEPVPADSGLPSGTLIKKIPEFGGFYLEIPENDVVLEERVGVFYCDTNTTDDYTRLQLIMLAENAIVKALKRTVTVSFNESVTLEMEITSETISSSSLRWLSNGSPLPNCANQSSCDVSLAGIYECYADGQRHLGIHGIVRVIVRECSAEMWDPSSGCNKVCAECINGGVCQDKIGICICPIGFEGVHCEKTKWYFDIVIRYADHASQYLYCLPDPYGCSCFVGYHGMNCELECDSNHFGTDCAQECHCAMGGCNQYRGECDSEECATGWSGPSCQYNSSSIVSFTYEKPNSVQQTRFTCVIQAYPRPLESEIIIEQTDHELSISNINFDYDIDPENHRAIVVSSNVTFSNLTVYTCRVSSKAVAGATYKNIPDSVSSLSVAPTLANGPVIEKLGSKQISLSWTPWSEDTDLGEGPVSNYRVYYRPATQLNFSLFGETNETSLTVTGLEENTTYHFSVAAFSDSIGWGDYSPSTPATTLSSGFPKNKSLLTTVLGGSVAVVIVIAIIVALGIFIRYKYIHEKDFQDLSEKKQDLVQEAGQPSPLNTDTETITPNNFRFQVIATISGELSPTSLNAASASSSNTPAARRDLVNNHSNLENNESPTEQENKLEDFEEDVRSNDSDAYDDTSHYQCIEENPDGVYQSLQTNHEVFSDKSNYMSLSKVD